MSESDDRSREAAREGQRSPYARDPRHWSSDPELQRQRLEDQVDIIRGAFPDVEVELAGGPPDGTERMAPGAPQHLYRRSRLLVRDADLARVDAVLGGDPTTVQDRVDRSTDADGPRMVNGLTSYVVQPERTTLEALELIDRELGVGVATPDHLLYVTSNAGCCPATEPEQADRTTPDPPVNTDATTSGRGVLVSVVDTGLQTGLVESSPHTWVRGIEGDPETSDPARLRHYVGHGTFVAGVVRTMAPQAQVYVDGFLPTGGAVYESEIIRQLGEALERVPDIICLSAGAWTRRGLPLMSFEVFYETRLRHLSGTVLVAAAGNDGNRGPFWPAAFPWALAVGALDADGPEGATRAWYTNYGSWVDVYARGTDVVNVFPEGEYFYEEAPHKGQTATFAGGLATWSGTSFATPLVAGLIAGRMSRTGENAQDAAAALRLLAREHAQPGVGPILRPGMS